MDMTVLQMWRNYEGGGNNGVEKLQGWNYGVGELY